MAPSSRSATDFNHSDLGFGLRELDNLKFRFVKAAKMGSSSWKVKRKWKRREERRRVDNKYDVVLVDGLWFSDSEFDNSDWSIGWLEPHAPDFQSDDEADDNLLFLFPAIDMITKDEDGA